MLITFRQLVQQPYCLCPLEVYKHTPSLCFWLVDLHLELQCNCLLESLTGSEYLRTPYSCGPRNSPNGPVSHMCISQWWRTLVVLLLKWMSKIHTPLNSVIQQGGQCSIPLIIAALHEHSRVMKMLLSTTRYIPSRLEMYALMGKREWGTDDLNMGVYREG